MYSCHKQNLCGETLCEWIRGQKQSPGGGSRWRRCLSVEQKEWRSLSVSAETVEKMENNSNTCSFITFLLFWRKNTAARCDLAAEHKDKVSARRTWSVHVSAELTGTLIRQLDSTIWTQWPLSERNLMLQFTSKSRTAPSIKLTADQTPQWYSSLIHNNLILISRDEKKTTCSIKFKWTQTELSDLKPADCFSHFSAQKHPSYYSNPRRIHFLNEGSECFLFSI